jgi:hypothetical protein
MPHQCLRASTRLSSAFACRVSSASQRYGAWSLAAMLQLLLIINILFLNASSTSLGLVLLGLVSVTPRSHGI